MRFYTILVAFIWLVAAGCSDTSVTEVDQNNKGETPNNEDPPKIITEEPPELVQVYNDLWMEISHEQSRGIVDTGKVLEANRMAVELSKYDGQMAQTFEFFEFIGEALLAGKSAEEIKQDVKEFRWENFPLMGKIDNVCTEDCNIDYWEQIDFIHDQGLSEALECGVDGLLVVGAGFWLGPVTAFLGLGGSLTCMGFVIYEHQRDLRRAKKDLGTCLDRCDKPE